MQEVNVNNSISFYVKKFTSKAGNEIVALYVKISDVEQMLCFLPKNFKLEDIK